MKLISVGQFSGPEGQLQRYDKMIEGDVKPDLTLPHVKAFVRDAARRGYCYDVRLDDDSVLYCAEICK